MAAELGLAVNVIQAFEVCIRAYGFISDANNIGRDGTMFFSRLQWEHYRVLEWGKRTGLDSSSPSNQLNWGYATRLLGDQQALLSLAAKLTARYSFESTVEDDSMALSQGEDPKERQNNKFIDYLTRLRPELFFPNPQVGQKKKGIIKRFRWASVDKDEANRLVLNIANINDQLQALLDSADREWLRHAISDLLRDIISRCDDVNEVDTIESLLNPKSISSNDALRAAVSLKQIRLLVGGDKTARKNRVLPPNMPTLRQLSHGRLQAPRSSPVLEYTGFEVCLYDEKEVLVDWRVVSKTAWVKVKGNMQRLAIILTHLSDPSFHTLPLLGLLPWQEECRFGFTYELPSTPEHIKKPWRHVSLSSLMQHCPTASLTRRIEIAIQMAETVLQFHTAGWLHKAIRSENIIFMAHDGDDVVSMIYRRAYLVGFEYARPDTKAGLALTELPDTPLLVDLYRHPKARGIYRESYRKHFDIYGLGCLLLELALWKPLLEIVSISHGIETQRNIAAKMNKGVYIALPSFLDISSNENLEMSLLHCAGKSFYEAIETCFSSEIFEGDEKNGLLFVQKRIVEQLHRCKP